MSRASPEKPSVIVTKAPYKHVHYHAAKRTWGYQVKATEGALAQNGYSSAEAAAKAVSIKLGVSMRDLRAGAKQRKPNRSRIEPILKCLLRVYAPNGDERAAPGDLLDLRQRGSNPESAVHASIVMRAVILLAKYGPWRSALEAAFALVRDKLLAAADASQQAMQAAQWLHAYQVAPQRGAKRKRSLPASQAGQVSQGSQAHRASLSTLLPGVDIKTKFTSHTVHSFRL